MRVLIINTSERKGGAAVAAGRLLEALNNNGVKAKMLVGEKQTDDLSVVPLKPRWRHRWHFLWERWCVFCHLFFSRSNLFRIDIANIGTDITRLPEFREADVVHLHWINQGMLSLKGIRKILKSGKPVVWTMHDIWPATALCHLTLGCPAFKTGCHHCKYLPGGGSADDLAARTWHRKETMLDRQHVTFVACSNWLADEARKSALLRSQTIMSIPNPIDMRVFCPKDKGEARNRLKLPADKRLLLFAAQRVNNVSKGIDDLSEACSTLVARRPELCEEVCLLLLGSHTEEAEGAFGGIAIRQLGYVSDTATLVDIYNAADAFVLPSHSENLPNTIMEAMACGTPCIGYRVGGIPEMIDHRRNGYVANYRDTDDLANGLYWTLFEASSEHLSAEAVRKVAQNYSQSAVASRYYEVYQQMLTLKHLCL